jgi:hypothetical protein
VTLPLVEARGRSSLWQEKYIRARSSSTLPTPSPARKVRTWLLLAGGVVIVLAVVIVLLLVFLR